MESIIRILNQAFDENDYDFIDIVRRLSSLDEVVYPYELSKYEVSEDVIQEYFNNCDQYKVSEEEEIIIATTKIKKEQTKALTQVLEPELALELAPLLTQTPALELAPEPAPAPTLVGSYQLGKDGEDIVMKLLQDAAPTFTITNVGKTSHVGDIHVDDEVNNIKYVVEVKQKKRITKEDLIKFRNDLQNITEKTDSAYVYGIFISLNTTTIPTIGSTSCDRRSVYLTEGMITTEVLKLIFSMVPEYVQSLNTISEYNNTPREVQVIEYQVPTRIREMLAQLQAYNNDLDIELNHLNAIKNSAQVISTEAAQLHIKYLVRRNFVLDLNTEIARSGIEEFTNASIIGGSGISSLDSDVAFLEYMKNQKPSKITKKELKEKFPAHITEISSMKLTDLKKYAMKK